MKRFNHLSQVKVQTIDMFLNAQDKLRVRSIAREVYVDHRVENDDRRCRVRELLKARYPDKYGSLIGSILLSIAVRLAMQLILKWIEDKVSTPPHGYQKDEPGYSG
jgi:hypothetical protein